MGTGPAGRGIFTVGVTTRRSGVLVWVNEIPYLYLQLGSLKNPYGHGLQNWPLLTQVSLECFQKRAFFKIRFLLGFSVSGFTAEGGIAYLSERVVVATCRTCRTMHYT
jgi:hypothetical protein